MAAFICLLLLTVFGVISQSAAQLELDDRFLEYRKNGMWLVEFYAPWCGHCKKLEPIFHEVSKELQQMGSPVRAAKVDCTRFSGVASQFSVRGFPTIMFISGDRIFTHHGDRTKEDILEFAQKAQGPSVRKLTSIGKFNEALSRHSSSVFFLFIGPDDEHNDLFTKYSLSADTHAIHSYFYHGKRNILENHEIKRHPTILVFKDKNYYEYQAPNGIATGSSVEAWINRERYPTFPKSSGPGLNEMSGSAEYLLILATEAEDFQDPGSKSSRLYEVVRNVAFGQRDKFHSRFQFVWMDEMDTLSSIASSFLSSPSLIALRTSDQYYFVPTGSLGNGTVDKLGQFLTRVVSGEEKAYGGTGFFMRLWRLFFDIASTIVGIWQASRWLFLLMFCLPTLIISIICYSLCCMDAIDDVPYDSEEEEEEDGEHREPAVGWSEGMGEGELRRRMYDRSEPLPPAFSQATGPPPDYGSLPNAQQREEDKKNE